MSTIHISPAERRAYSQFLDDTDSMDTSVDIESKKNMLISGRSALLIHNFVANSRNRKQKKQLNTPNTKDYDTLSQNQSTQKEIEQQKAGESIKNQETSRRVAALQAQENKRISGGVMQTSLSKKKKTGNMSRTVAKAVGWSVASSILFT